jgi:uncharacterized membrane protein
MIIGVVMTLIVTLSVPVLVVSAILKAVSQPIPSTIVFLVVAVGFLATALTLIAGVGIRTWYYYFKMPKTYRR